jgi:anti-sigma factor (TIGR02949 family)
MPDRLDCEQVVRRLWPFLDGALPDTDRVRVARHLDACGGCRSHFDFASAFLDAVHAVRPGESEFSALRGRVVDALATEGFPNRNRPV